MLTDKKYTRHHFDKDGKHIGITTWFKGMQPKRIIGERHFRDAQSTAQQDSWDSELFDGDLVNVFINGQFKKQLIKKLDNEWVFYPSGKKLSLFTEQHEEIEHPYIVDTWKQMPTQTVLETISTDIIVNKYTYESHRLCSMWEQSKIKVK